MIWIAPSEEDAANHPLEKRLSAAADQFRANSGLKSSQYSTPVLGLIFLRFTDARFAKHRARHNPNVSPCLNGGFNPVQLGPGRAAPRLAGGDDPRHGCPT